MKMSKSISIMAIATMLLSANAMAADNLKDPYNMFFVSNVSLKDTTDVQCKNTVKNMVFDKVAEMKVKAKHTTTPMLFINDAESNKVMQALTNVNKETITWKTHNIPSNASYMKVKSVSAVDTTTNKTDANLLAITIDFDHSQLKEVKSCLNISEYK